MTCKSVKGAALHLLHCQCTHEHLKTTGHPITCALLPRCFRQMLRKKLHIFCVVAFCFAFLRTFVHLVCICLLSLVVHATCIVSWQGLSCIFVCLIFWSSFGEPHIYCPPNSEYATAVTYSAYHEQLCCLHVLILLYRFPVCGNLVVLACYWRQSCQLWLFCNNIYIYIYINIYIHILYIQMTALKKQVLALLPLLSSLLFTLVLKLPHAYADMLQIIVKLSGFLSLHLPVMN